MKEIRIFDNYEEDGQLSLFGLESLAEPAGPEIRISRCASCGKLLFVKEDTAGFHAECNNCGIKYLQKF